MTAENRGTNASAVLSHARYSESLGATRPSWHHWLGVPGQWRRWVLFCCLAVITSLAVRGQQPREPVEGAAPPAVVAPAVEESEPTTIPEADVLTQATDVAQEVRRIGLIAEPSSEVVTATEEFASSLAAMTELQAELDDLDPARVSLRNLEDHRQSWTDRSSQLEGWRAPLQRRWETLQGERETIRAESDLWQRTLDASSSLEEYPPELLEREAEALGRLSDAEELLSERIGELAAVLDRLTEREQRIADALARLAEVETIVRRRVLVRDATVLWNVGAEVGPPLPTRAREVQVDLLGTLADFVEQRQESVYVQVALFVLLLLGCFGLWWRSRSWPEDDERLEGARFVASRPIAVALALGTFSTRWILGSVPEAVESLLVLIAVLSVARLAAGVVSRAALPGVYSLIGLYLLNYFWYLAPDGALGRRILLLGVTVLDAAVVGLIARRWSRPDVLPAHRWGRFGLAGLFVASWLLVVSVVCNLLGWLTLAELLTDATIAAALSFVGWLVVVRVVRGLVRLLPAGVLGRLFPSLHRYEDSFVRSVMLVVYAIAVVNWTRSMLTRFRILEPLSEWVEKVLSASLTWGSLTLSLGSIGAAVIIVIVAVLLSRFVRFVLREEILPRLRVPSGADNTVLTVVHYGILTLGVLLAASAAGLNTTQLTVVFGALSVGIGFGLQHVVNNFVSGLVLLFERPIKVGDRVQASGYLGTVTNIGMRATTVRTFDGSEVIVPNGDLISKEVTNWTLSDPNRRAEIRLGVEYGNDPTAVIDILESVTRGNEKVLELPEPRAYFVRFGESALEFRLLFWTQGEHILEAPSDVHVEIDVALRQAGIKIAFPQTDVHIRSAESGSGIDPSKGEPADAD